MAAARQPGDMRSPLNLRAVLIDLNGTIHVGKDPTPRAVEALKRLRARRIPFIFCSNSTKESTRSLLEHLRGLGFDVKGNELMTSLGACRELVERRKLNPYLLLSCSAKEEFEDYSPPSAGHDSVILGLHPPSLSYEPLNKAFRILKGEPIQYDSQTPANSQTQSQSQIPTQPILIAPHASLFQQSPATDDLPAGLSLGIGPFVRALETASGVEPELVGKPTKRFFELAIERIREIYGVDLDLEKGEVGVIGDDVVNDLGQGAKELGLKRVLVRTGKYREGVEAKDPPDAVYDNFAAFVDHLLEE